MNPVTLCMVRIWICNNVLLPLGVATGALSQKAESCCKCGVSERHSLNLRNRSALVLKSVLSAFCYADWISFPGPEQCASTSLQRKALGSPVWFPAAAPRACRWCTRCCSTSRRRGPAARQRCSTLTLKSSGRGAFRANQKQHSTNVATALSDSWLCDWGKHTKVALGLYLF